MITDLDFADDLAILTEEMEQAQQVLNNLEQNAGRVGLLCNAKKTELQVFNHNRPIEIIAKNGETLKVVENFKYLGAWTESTEKDISVRKALAWSACHKLREIWKSKLSNKLKIRLFISTIETVLLYGSETWTLTKALTKQIDGCYTRMLRMVLNVSWRDRIRNEQLYGNLPKVSTKIRQRRMSLAGHCLRHEEEIASKLVLWRPEGRANRGRRRLTYIDNLLQDTGQDDIKDLQALMNDRNV
jgi:hypothetical protein